MTERSESSLSEDGVRLSEQFANLARRWQPVFTRLTKSRLRDADLGSALCADLFYVLSKLSQPYGSRPTEALVDLTLPILASLNYDAFGAFKSWNLQDAVSEADFEPLPAEVPSTCMFFASKGEKQAVGECASAFLDLFSTLHGNERSTEERQIAESFVTAIRLLMRIELSSDQRLADCALLDLPEQHNREELRGAYRKKVQAWHPDRLEGMAPELRVMATEQMTTINAAYERLQSCEYPDHIHTPSEQVSDVVRRTDGGPLPVRSDLLEVDQVDFLSPEVPSTRQNMPRSHVIAILVGVLVCVLAIASVFVNPATKRDESRPVAQNQERQGLLPERRKLVPTEHADKTAVDSTAMTKSEAPVDEETRAQVSDVLQRWVSAMASNDVNQMLPFYADHLERYFLQRNVDRTAVRESKENWLSTGNRMTAFEMRSPIMERGPGGQVIVHLYKQVSDVDANSLPMSTDLLIRSELRLAMFSGEWEIVSERDFK